MNRAFSIEFHNGFSDLKPIVTMSVKVNHGSRFKKLDAEGRSALVAQLKAFKNAVEKFEKEIDGGVYHNEPQGE